MNADPGLHECLEAFFQDKPVLKVEYFRFRTNRDSCPATRIELLVTPASHAFHHEILRMENQLAQRIEKHVSILLHSTFEAFVKGPARELILRNVVPLLEKADAPPFGPP